MALTCPGCGTEDIRKVSLIYENGVQKTRSKTLFGGGLLGLLGPMLGLGAAVTRGTNKTLTAERLGPPQKMHPVLSAVIVFLGMLFFAFPVVILIGASISRAVEGIFGMIFTVALFGLPIWIFIHGMHYNSQYPELLEKWNGLFMCERCGDIFSREEAIKAEKASVKK